MSPAGGRDSLMAAVKAGANSVYFGVEQLNMRARSTMNFTLNDLEDVAAIGMEYGIKTYITLNTILYDHDLRLMKSIVDKAKNAGISAIIAADHAAIMYAHQMGMEVHISTQANITNVETVAFYAHFANTMVLSRELSLMQVKQITKEIARRKITGPNGHLVQIEVFAHGALCMAVSGKCYLSLHTHQASANRGACVQNCRRSYVVTDKEEGYELEIDNEYIMSAKDLCTIGFLDQVLDAGVSVLKIEGRGRSPEYVHVSTQCYREAIDSLKDGTYSEEKIKHWNARLETVFNRGFWEGYYLGKTMGEWNDSYGSKASHRKWHLGKGVKYFDKLGVGEFELEAGELTVGDEVVINGPTTGVIYHQVTEMRVDGKPVDKVRKGDVFSMPVPEKVRPSDRLFKWLKA
jgi:putative protease